jgi:uncharacterized protein (TIGR03790 family)
MMGIARAVAVTVCLGSFPAQLTAGGGPENVAVVVNPRSWASRTIANHYAQLRRIPACNVFLLDWDASVTQTDVEAFRRQLLTPILKAITARGLAYQIDYIVYSSDFPYSISFEKQLEQAGEIDMPRLAQMFPTGSLTGMTCLYQLVLANRPLYGAVNTNGYANTGVERSATRAFHAACEWQKGEKTSSSGLRFMLSTMLGYSSGRGNSVEEIVRYLRRSALADGTRPDGTIYFMTNDDVRTRTRSATFEPVVEALRREGVAARQMNADTPQGAKDIAGAMIGKAWLPWDRQSRILPGAIVENLTSFGGVLDDRGTQMPLTDFLRHGAAGSSGTVVEPFATSAKFPDPTIHLHYVRGLTLAEAFYRSVVSPYQLLVVGDPLCRPWARIPVIHVDGVPTQAPVGGSVMITPRAETGPDQKIAVYELFVDGRRVASAAPGGRFELDSTRLQDGYHELRVVGTIDDAIQTQGRRILPFVVNNHNHTIRCRLISSRQVTWDEKLVVEVDAPGADRVVAFYRGLPVGQTADARGKIVIDPRGVGLGPVVVDLVATRQGTPDVTWMAEPILCWVQPGPPLPAQVTSVGIDPLPGLTVSVAGGAKQVIEDTKDPKWLASAGAGSGDPYTLEALVTATVSGVHQLQVRFDGALGIYVDGALVFNGQTNRFIRHELPVHLAKGVHHLRMVGRVQDDPRLSIRFGWRGARRLSRENARYLPS